jgi:para-nitrobenzyl esterase
MIDRRSLMGASIGGLAASGLGLGTAIAAEAPVATTQHGRVRGVEDGGIRIFKGIPYARAQRFLAPTSPEPWAGVRDALAFGPMAPQSRGPLGSLFSSWTFDKEMSEDCQSLSVWTPALADNRKRPVMVWLHGGGFTSLSGSRNVFDGTRLARKGDVVVVTLNHRLNVFGYLQLAELAPAFPDAGNVGNMDIVVALRWVKDNIAEFGGDPYNVTIFGQSGGGGKVTTLMGMPSAKGLFHKAIVQSGSHYMRGLSAAEGLKLTEKLLAALEIRPADAASLATLPMDRLVEGFAKSARGPGGAVYRPVVDGRSLPSGPFAPDAPSLAMDIPMIIGTTATEMTLFTGTDKDAFDLDEAGLRKRVATLVAESDVDTVLASFRATRPEATPSDLYFAIITDTAYRRFAWVQSERKARQGGAKVWAYELVWKTPVDGGKWRSPHSLDLAMVFDNVALSASMVGTGPEPQKVADQMSAAWLAFAHTGDPNNAATVPWQAYDLGDRSTMVFDVESRVVKDFRGDERALMANVKPV